MAILANKLKRLTSCLPGFGLVMLTLTIALPTLWYPFGRDQGQYAYFAREWANGATPYLDLWDQKPPGFYLILMLFQTILGDRQVTPRIADVCAVLLIQLILVKFISRMHTSEELWSGWLAAAAVPLTYFGGFVYWDTAQPEVWEALFIAAAFYFASLKLTKFTLAVCSFFAGCAVVVKLPAAMILPALLLVLVVDVVKHRRLLGKDYALAGGAFLLPLSLMAVPSLSDRRAWSEMTEILLRYNAFYVKVKASEITSLDLFWQPLSFILETPVSLLLASLGLLAGWRKLPSRLWGLALLWAGASFAALMVQRKYYLYHYSVLVPPLCLFVGIGGATLVNALTKLRRKFRLPLYLGFLVLFTLGQVRHFYLGYVPRWWDYVTGSMGWFRFYTQFGGPDNYSYMSNAKIARFLEQNASSQDALAVEGYEPAVYTLTGMRCPSRFYSVFPLIDSKLAGFSPAWQQEYVTALRTAQPAWLVTTGAQPLYLPADYIEVERNKELAVWFCAKPGEQLPRFHREPDHPPPVIHPR